MKKSLLALLALAFCLSACTPVASEVTGETPATATTEAATMEEPAETSTFPVGSLVGCGDNTQTPGKMYHFYQESEDSPQSIIELDCDTGQESCLYTFTSEKMPDGPLLIQPDVIRRTVRKTLYTIPLDGGEVQTMPLEGRFEPAACDAYGAYEFWGGDWDVQRTFRRLDFATGQITELKTPDQVQSYWAVGQDRIILWRLVTETPLPDVHTQNEQYYAAIQSATTEYDWYDPATGELEKIYAEPYYGVEQADGSQNQRYFLGMAGDRLYFQNTHLLRGNPGVEVLDMQVESCAVDGTDWRTECDLTAGASGPGTFWEGPVLRWLTDSNEKDVLRIYDLADRTWYTPGQAAWNRTWPEELPGNGKVYLMQEQRGSDGSYEMNYVLADMDDYLAGTTDWTPVTPYTEAS